MITIDLRSELLDSRLNLLGGDQHSHRRHGKKIVSLCSSIKGGAKNYLGRAQHLHPPEPLWLTAVRAADSKQARDVVALDVREVSSFADYFVICSGTNSRQIQAIADEIEAKLKEAGEYPTSVEGYQNAEWVLVDYGDFVIHIFSEKARAYYDLERLWRGAKHLN
jgi:ribosome-associated protein